MMNKSYRKLAKVIGEIEQQDKTEGTNLTMALENVQKRSIQRTLMTGRQCK